MTPANPLQTYVRQVVKWWRKDARRANAAEARARDLSRLLLANEEVFPNRSRLAADSEYLVLAPRNTRREVLKLRVDLDEVEQYLGVSYDVERLHPRFLRLDWLFTPISSLMTVMSALRKDSPEHVEVDRYTFVMVSLPRWAAGRLGIWFPQYILDGKVIYPSAAILYHGHPAVLAHETQHHIAQNTTHGADDSVMARALEPVLDKWPNLPLY